MPGGGENHKQEAGKKTDSHRKNIQNLLSLVGRQRIEAAQDVVVPQSHRPEHKHAQDSMNPIDEPNLELGEIGEYRSKIRRVVKEPEACGSGKAVVDAAIGGLDAVGEGSEEAGEGEEEEEKGGHGAGGGVAGSVGGEEGGQQLKR